MSGPCPTSPPAPGASGLLFTDLSAAKCTRRVSRLAANRLRTTFSCSCASWCWFRHERHCWLSAGRSVCVCRLTRHSSAATANSFGWCQSQHQSSIDVDHDISHAGRGRPRGSARGVPAAPQRPPQRRPSMMRRTTANRACSGRAPACRRSAAQAARRSDRRSWRRRSSSRWRCSVSCTPSWRCAHPGLLFGPTNLWNSGTKLWNEYLVLMEEFVARQMEMQRQLHSQLEVLRPRRSPQAVSSVPTQ